MLEHGATILFDTNSIVEAVRIGAWNAIKNKYSATICLLIREELTRQDRNTRTLIPINQHDIVFRNCSEIVINDLDRFQLAIFRPRVDPGEFDLLALLNKLNLRQQAVWYCGPDRAAIGVLHELNMLHLIVTLENVARSSGASIASIKSQYTESWFGEVKTNLLFDSL